jgi:hypothetical protein
MVPSAVVERLLAICDPDGTLPVTTPQAEQLLRPTRADGSGSRPLLQLVPQPR